MTTRFTPDPITHLAPHEVMVFGSNREGRHYGGAAHAAWHQFGAVWGIGEGHQGQTYAIPSMGSLHELEHAATTFLAFARSHPELEFLLTPVGTGIARKAPQEVAPLFRGAPNNVIMPRAFAEVLEGEKK